MKKYLWMLSAAVVIGALRVKKKDKEIKKKDDPRIQTISMLLFFIVTFSVIWCERWRAQVLVVLYGSTLFRHVCPFIGLLHYYNLMVKGKLQ